MQDDRAATSAGRIERSCALTIAEWVPAVWYGLLRDIVVRAFN